MSFNVVFLLMLAVLLGLIFFSKVYRKKEKNLMNLETIYVDSLKRFKKNPSDDFKEVLKNGIAYGKMLGISVTQAEEMVNNDLSKIK